MKKKPEWLYRQSAVIPYLVFDDEVKVVLVSSSSKSGWVIPKGVIERNMSAQESAAKEALEEAGVKGEVHPIGINTYTYQKWNGTCTVQVFPLLVEEVLSEWSEMNKRERIIISIEEAIHKVKPEQKESVVKFAEFLNKNA